MESSAKEIKDIWSVSPEGQSGVRTDTIDVLAVNDTYSENDIFKVNIRSQSFPAFDPEASFFQASLDLKYSISTSDGDAHARNVMQCAPFEYCVNSAKLSSTQKSVPFFNIYSGLKAHSKSHMGGAPDYDLVNCFFDDAVSQGYFFQGAGEGIKADSSQRLADPLVKAYMKDLDETRTVVMSPIVDTIVVAGNTATVTLHGRQRAKVGDLVTIVGAQFSNGNPVVCNDVAVATTPTANTFTLPLAGQNGDLNPKGTLTLKRAGVKINTKQLYETGFMDHSDPETVTTISPVIQFYNCAATAADVIEEKYQIISGVQSNVNIDTLVVVVRIPLRENVDPTTAQIGPGGTYWDNFCDACNGTDTNLFQYIPTPSSMQTNDAINYSHTFADSNRYCSAKMMVGGYVKDFLQYRDANKATNKASILANHPATDQLTLGAYATPNEISMWPSIQQSIQQRCAVPPSDGIQSLFADVSIFTTNNDLLEQDFHRNQFMRTFRKYTQTKEEAKAMADYTYGTVAETALGYPCRTTDELVSTDHESPEVQFWQLMDPELSTCKLTKSRKWLDPDHLAGVPSIVAASTPNHWTPYLLLGQHPYNSMYQDALFLKIPGAYLHAANTMRDGVLSCIREGAILSLQLRVDNNAAPKVPQSTIFTVPPTAPDVHNTMARTAVPEFQNRAQHLSKPFIGYVQVLNVVHESQFQVSPSATATTGDDTRLFCKEDYTFGTVADADDPYYKDTIYLQVSYKSIVEGGFKMQDRVTFENFPEGFDSDQTLDGITPSELNRMLTRQFLTLGVSVEVGFINSIGYEFSTDNQTALEVRCPIESQMTLPGHVIENMGYGLQYTARLESFDDWFRSPSTNQFVKKLPLNDPLFTGNPVTDAATIDYGYTIKRPGFRLETVTPSPDRAAFIQQAIASQAGLQQDYTGLYTEKIILPAGTLSRTLQLFSARQSRALAMFCIFTATQYDDDPVHAANIPPFEMFAKQYDATTESYALKRLKNMTALHDAETSATQPASGLFSYQLQKFGHRDPTQPINVASITTGSPCHLQTNPIGLKMIDEAIRVCGSQVRNSIDSHQSNFMIAYPFCHEGNFAMLQESNMSMELKFSAPTTTELTMLFVIAHQRRITVANGGGEIKVES